MKDILIVFGLMLIPTSIIAIIWVHFIDKANKKIERFKNINYIDDDVERYIKPLKRNNEQYGWYVYINKKRQILVVFIFH